MHMYPPSSMCGPNILSLGGIVIEKLYLNLMMSIDNENEVKVS